MLTAASLSFAIAGQGSNAEQALALRTDASGNVYELTTYAVNKFSAAGVQIWSAPYTASSQLGQKEGLAVDGSGDVYITGSFSNLAGSPAQFGGTSLVAAGVIDGYLAKLDSSGTFLWAESFGGGVGADAGYAVATDAAGDAYVTGAFNDSLTIGAGAQAKTFKATGGSEILAAKFDQSGTLLWANAYDNASFNHGYGIAVDAQGDAYVTGDFWGNMDFDPAQAGTQKLTTFFPTAFLLKLDSGGGFGWVKKLNANTSAGDGQAAGKAIAVDTAGNIYSTGTFGGPVELDPNGGDLNVSADFVFPDAYVLKLDSAGNFGWAADLHDVSVTNPFGGLQPNDISVDSQGNVYTAGGYNGVANFDPVGTHLQASNGGQDIYVSALTSQGKFNWVATAGESPFGDEAYGVATTSTSNGTYVYAAGTFSNTVNFNPGAGAPDNVTSASTWDSFLWGLNGLPTRIAGVVWNDQNGDGVRQAAEPGLPGVPVALFVGAPGSGTQVASTVSDSLGLYSFNSVATGQNYYVQVGLPPGDALTAENSGADLSAASNVSATTGQSSAIGISPGQTVVVNAGMKQVVPLPAFGLAFGIPTGGFITGSSILSDSIGDIYVGGVFDGTTTFGSGPGAVTFKTGANNDFVAKYTPGGALVWVQQVASKLWEYAPKLAFDSFGNLYVAGLMTGDATIGTVALQASADTAFLAKMDTSGNTLWATTVISDVHDYNVGLAVDPLGNAYVTGGFTGSTTVNTSPVTNLSSAGGYDAFLVKYSPYGAAQWAQSYGGTKDDSADSVAVDPAGNPVITGVFDGTAKFGGISLISGSAGVNDFIAKLNASNGTVAWARALSSTVSSGQILFDVTQPLNRIAIDSQGNVYTTGYFDGTIQLDPTSGSDALKGTNSDFISKLDANGRFVWGKVINTNPNGYDVHGNGIALDARGDVFTIGEFAQTSNFNPNSGTAHNLTAISASYDIFISELDKTGTYINAQQFGGAGEDSGTAISVDAFGNVYATGESEGPATFATATVGAASEQDIFVLRLGNNFGLSVNGPPSFNLLGPLQAVGLNAPPQTVPGFAGNIVPGLPGETNELTSFIITRDDNSALFSVQPAVDQNGTLTYTPAAGVAGTANITVVLHNNGGTANGGTDTSAPQTFPITVDVNHAPTFTVGPDQTVNENTGSHRVSGWATNIIPGPPGEAGQSVNFTVSTSNDSLFSVLPAVDSASGDLTYTLAPDVFGAVTVTVQLHDNGGTANGGADTSTQTFTIIVNLVDHAPSFIEGASQTINENAGPQSVLPWATSISAGPPSESAQLLNFIVTTDNPTLFSVAPAIDPVTGALTYTPATNVSGVANVSVQLHDNGGTANGGVDTSAAQAFTITVNFINQPPSFLVKPNVEVLENSGPQTAVKFATSISPGAAQEKGQLLNFNLSTDNDALFSVAPRIDPITGALTFTPATNAFGVANVTVNLHDNGGTANGGKDTSATQTFTITVDLLNHAPGFVVGADQVANENSGVNTAQTWATQISAGPLSEAGQALNFIVTTDNDALFATPPQIDPATGDLTYTPATDQSGVANVSVALHDNGGTAFGGADTSSVQTFTITINFVNQPPSFASIGDETVHETPGTQTVDNWATQISAGAPNETSQKLNFVVTTDYNALFSSLPQVDPTSGNLTYTPAVYAVGVAHVTVKLHDDGGTTNGGIDASPPQTFTITVTQSNQAPTFTPGKDQTPVGSLGPQTVPGWATSITPGPANEIAQALNFVVSTDNNSLFSTQPAIDPSGNLTYTPVPGMSGQAHVTVQLHDDGGTANGGVDTSAPVTFLIKVTFVNQAPSFTVGANDALNENATAKTVVGWATNIVAGPPDEIGQALNFVVTTDNNALFSVSPAVDPATGDLTYTPAHNANGVAHVTVKLHDNGGTANAGQDTSAGKTFTITVNPVNQVPLFAAGPSLQVLENSGLQTDKTWATGISAGAANELSQQLNFIVSTDDDALFSATPSIDPASGNLSFAPALDANGMAHVTIRLRDDGGTTNGGQDTSAASMFTITVLPVNQPPTFAAQGDQAVDEGAAPQTVQGWASKMGPGAANEAGQALNFVVTTDSPALFSSLPQVDAATGDLTYATAPNVSGVAHVSVRLHDDGGVANGGADTSPPLNFTITVNFINEAPGFSIAGDPPAVNENSGTPTIANFATAMTASGSFPVKPDEVNQAIHFNVIGDSNPTLFAIPPTIDSAGTLRYTLNPGANGTSQITVALQDNGGTAHGGADTSPPKTLEILVNFVNEAPHITHLGLNQVVQEDSGKTSVPGWATASTGPGPGGAPQNISYVVTAANPALFTADGQPAIDPAGTLTFTPASHVFSTTLVTVLAKNDGGTDNGGQDTSQPVTFHISIEQANHAPTVANSIGPIEVDENATDAVFSNLSNVFDDVDIPLGDHLSLSLSGNSNPSLVTASLSSANPASGVLTLHFLPDQVGTATIDLRATDQTGASVDEPIAVTVDQVPTFVAGSNLQVAMGSNQQSVPGWATNISSGTMAGHSLSFAANVISTNNPALFSTPPAIDSNGDLTFTPATGQIGKATTSVTLHDNVSGSTSAAQTFVIEVDAPPVAKNESFVLSVGPSSSAAVNVGVVAGSSDPSGRPLTATVVSPPTNGTLQLNADGSFTYTKGPNFQGVDSFTYELSDGLSTSNVATVNITAYEATIVTKLYQQVLNRPPDAQGLEYWTNQIQQGQPYSVVAQGIFESDERLDPIIEGYYQQFLLRPADATGLAYWRDQVWKSYGGPEPVIAGMISSPEFYASAGQAKPNLSPNAAWVTSLYERLLNREPDADGLKFWTDKLDSGQLGRVAVVNGFEMGAEAFQNVTIAFFQQYLGRNPTSDELSNYVSALETGATQRTIQIEIIDGTEYRNTPPPPAAGNVNRLS